MIDRDIAPRLVELFERYPFVTVTGPRQSGKTTLCRETFPSLKYINLEAPDQREFAESDPRGLLATLDGSAILDEIQRAPGLLSYLQVFADERGRNSLFVLTGSEHFKLSEAISQSLAGRTALLRLLPFSLVERQRIGADNRVDEILYAGFYPRIYDQELEPRQALSDYFETYVERDVRRMGGVGDLSAFRQFAALCAGRVGSLLDLTSLGNDVGVSRTTIRNWLAVLERSYIVFLLQPYHANIRKRLVKTPKIYFYDVGLTAHLLGIQEAGQIATHPLRGQMFENIVVAEAVKHCWNRGRRPRRPRLDWLDPRCWCAEGRTGTAHRRRIGHLRGPNRLPPRHRRPSQPDSRRARSDISVHDQRRRQRQTQFRRRPFHNRRRDPSPRRCQRQQMRPAHNRHARPIVPA